VNHSLIQSFKAVCQIEDVGASAPKLGHCNPREARAGSGAGLDPSGYCRCPNGTRLRGWAIRALRLVSGQALAALRLAGQRLGPKPREISYTLASYSKTIPALDGFGKFLQSLANLIGRVFLQEVYSLDLHFSLVRPAPAEFERVTFK